MAAESRYTLIRQIAQGGMAEVWKASAGGAAGFAKTVAIKRILPGLAKDREFVDRFIAEARMAAALVHPNIVQVFDFGELEPGTYFLAMEYVPGVDAFTLARHAWETGFGDPERTGVGVEAPPDSSSTAGDGGPRGMLPPQVAIHICMETARGLGYAHSRTPSIIHRDVSPQNILVSFDGEVKLADFGIAKISGTSTQSAVIKGKLSYMSPEQTRGERVDGRSDLFSLGVTLYRMLTGRALFAGDTLGERVAAASSYTGIRSEALELVPANVRPVLERALRGKPQERFPDAGAMEAALGECLGTAATVTIRRTLASYVRQCAPDAFRQEQREHSHAMTGGSSLMRKPPRRTGLWVGLGAGALALGAVGLAVGPFAAGPPTPPPTPTPAPVAAATATQAPVATIATITAAPAITTPTKPAAGPSPVASAKPIERDVQTYDVGFLDGCSPAELTLADASIRGAIRRGIPLFNKGDTAGCFEVYRDTALSVRGALPESCAGPRAALQLGLERAARLATPAEKAYAVRDAFDGLLAVMTKRRAENASE